IVYHKMMHTRLRFFASFCLAVAVCAAAHAASSPAPSNTWRLAVRFLPKAHSEPFTGRAYIFFGKAGEPRHGPNWFRPQPFLSKDVTNWNPGETLEFTSGDKALLSFPAALKVADLAGRRAQAVVRFNPFEREVGDGAGNGYSAVVTLPEAGQDKPWPELIVDKLVPAPTFTESASRKEIRVPSRLLSNFYGHDVAISAAVILPASYETAKTRRYPTIFTIPGFGGTHYQSRGGRQAASGPKDVEFLRVLLDPSCP